VEAFGEEDVAILGAGDFDIGVAGGCGRQWPTIRARRIWRTIRSISGRLAVPSLYNL